MKKYVLPLFLLAAISSFGQSPLLKKASGLLNKAKGGHGSLSNDEIVAGLKDALTIGAQNSASKLSATDGFFANAAVKVLMPEEAKRVENTLRNAGMGSLVDKAILSMNRAAEQASKSAAPIFVDAIRQMSFQDAFGILKGSDSAATLYLKDKTTDQLTAAFRPTIDSALQQTGATRYWKELFEAYNRIPLTRKVNTDLSGYVTGKALSGIFYQVGLEERNIRKNPTARVTDILKKVFGS